MRRVLLLLLATALFAAPGVSAQNQTAAPAVVPERISRAQPVVNLASTIDRPLRYQPDGTDFVIVNGPEFFNRPVYADNSPFRFDGGDKPEFSLYLYGSGHGGNLRFGFQTAAGAKWCNDAARVVARYRPGSLLYEISDPLLGTATLKLAVLALAGTQGLVARAELDGGPPVTLVWAYGGADGAKGQRDGDIGCERLPVGELFQLKSQNARGNTFTVQDSSFLLHSRPATFVGLASPNTQIALADASDWNSLPDLLASAGKSPSLPLAVGQVPLASGQPVYFALQRLPQSTDNNAALSTYTEAGGQDGNQTSSAASTSANSTSAAPSPVPDFTVATLPALFDDAENHRRAIAEQVVVDTPDPFINAAVAALCVAADAIWDKGTWDPDTGTYVHPDFEHGAVAWRSKLLGWRGPYAADALGWHDRAVSHLTYWAGQQNTDDIPAVIPTADPKVNLSRDEPALISNGDMSKSHYDMNLVYIDALFRHIFWTGDLDFARSVWPVIERHLAWERRLFRRQYGADNVPLYEAYAAIWASDDLEYDGGGATHTTAYNYYHNLLAAQLAQLLGKDPTPYDKEAALIQQAMHAQLWLPNQGWFAESKDLLGLQLDHPNPALWTFYHTVDSQAATPFEAWQMSRYVDTQIPHFPIQGPGVPDGGYFTLSTTNWMPYTWSLNNVVMAEAAHTSLAYWQTGRLETAFLLFKGCLLDSMYLGLCPGNAGAMTGYDMARGEAQRDFGDAIGITSRALVEGLFGVRPDALNGEVLVRPGFPADWDHASIRHPDFTFSYQRGDVTVTHADLSTVVKKATVYNAPVISHQDVATETLTETYSFEPKFPVPMKLRLQVVARRDSIANLSVNGQPGAWSIVEDSIGTPRVEISAPAATHDDIVITWQGADPATVTAPTVVPYGGELRAQVAPAVLLKVDDPQNALNRLDATASTLQGIAVGLLGHRTVFVEVQQGQMRWWLPVPFEIREGWQLLPSESQDASSLRFRVRNNTPNAFDHDVQVSSGANTASVRLQLPAFGESDEIALPAAHLLPGSNVVSAQLGNGLSVDGVVTNWQLQAEVLPAAWTPINLAPLFNDRVTQIFKHDYLSPRSPYCSLSIPKQGIGTWCSPNLTADINDTGLRAAAAQGNGWFVLPQNVPFLTPGPGDTPNIAFVSQWDNFPRSIDIPLSGTAAHAYFLMAGSTNPMQSRLDNGEVIVTYADGSTERLALRNPTTWWPIEQDYYIDDFAFRRPEALPPRVNLKTGLVRTLELADFEGRGGKISGGAATVLDLPLDPQKPLKSLTVRALANDVVIGLMAATLVK
jgi:hypothetical protein